MKILQTAFVCGLMLVATTALAARQPKELICHVGNEVGPGGEVYLDDPGCVPIEENDYFCPDAGKVDLIEVANADKHLNQPSHAFGGISDYRPADVGASGEGDEDSDGDGIDDGCQPPVLETCPCWTAGVINSIDGTHPDGSSTSFYTQPPQFNVCEEYASVEGVYYQNTVYSNEDSFGPGTGYCQTLEFYLDEGGGYTYLRDSVYLEYLGEGQPGNTLTLEELQACTAQVQACVERVTQ